MRPTNFTFHSLQTKLFAAIFVVVFSIFAGDAAFGQVTPPMGIVAWLPGDGDACDLSGNGNNGTLGTGASYKVGKVGQAFRFDGTPNGYVNIGTPATTSQIFTVGTVRQGQIIYNRIAANASVDGTIWAIYPNGAGDHQITTGSYPRISPDGNYLAFKRKHSETTDPNINYGLWVMNLTTGAETEIFYAGDVLVGFDWTPDSAKIVFDQGCTIYRINPDGSNLVSLVNGCFYDAPAVQPIGGLLAFHATGLYKSNADGSNLQQIPNTGSGNYFPAWSKDGQFISYINYPGGGAHPYYGVELYKIKPDGTGKILLKSLTGTDRFGSFGAWSADGTKIYMPAIIGGVTGIYEVATDGSGTMSLASDSPNLIAAGTNVEFVGGVNGLVPTAASVAIGGRVTVGKKELARARVILTDGNGETRYAMTNPFGYYRFDKVAAGATYIITINHKRYSFMPQVVSVTEDLTELNFMAEQ